MSGKSILNMWMTVSRPLVTTYLWLQITALPHFYCEILYKKVLFYHSTKSNCRFFQKCLPEVLSKLTVLTNLPERCFAADFFAVVGTVYWCFLYVCQVCCQQLLQRWEPFKKYLLFDSFIYLKYQLEKPFIYAEHSG